MDISKRLKLITEYINPVNVLCDVGTDHGYIPIYAIKNNLCLKAIASDINKDPLDRAKLNTIFENIVGKEIEFRLGGGLSTIKKGEVNAVIIAGMGGNLIRDILENDLDKVKELDYLILQPAQNPEVLRKYLYNSGYEIIEEDLCFEEGKYYEFFKVKKVESGSTELDEIYYEISPRLLMKRHSLLKEFLNDKLDTYNKILSFITDDTEPAQQRKDEISQKISIISGMISNIG